MRLVLVPHTTGMVDYKGEDFRLFNQIGSTGSAIICEYAGNSDEAVWETYIDPTPVVTISDLSGAGVLQYIPEQNLAIIAVGQPVTITATNDGPAGTWSTPVQSPTKVGYATTTKVEGENTMTIEYTFDEDGDWYLTEQLINRDLSGFSFKFTDFHFKVVK